MPAVKQCIADYEAKGFLVLGVDHDPRIEIMTDFLAQKGYDWPQWWIGDRRKEIHDQFWITLYPTEFLVGRDGKILTRTIRLPTGRPEIEKALTKP